MKEIISTLSSNFKKRLREQHFDKDSNVNSSSVFKRTLVFNHKDNVLNFSQALSLALFSKFVNSP